MSYWEPRWVRKEFSSHGITVVTCLDLTTSLMLCPICSTISIEELCPSDREGNLPVADVPLFFSVDDLINHMRTHWHAKRYKKIRVPTTREVSEESEKGVLRKFANGKPSGKRG
ncbi:MAG: hypothetical protein QW489_01460 [Sulfolobales archaeon]